MFMIKTMEANGHLYQIFPEPEDHAPHPQEDK
jgi:hypothetical protein